MPVLSLSLTARSYILANPLDLSFVLHYVDENKDIITVPINDVEGLSPYLDDKKAYKELSKKDKLAIKAAIEHYHRNTCSDESLTYYHNMNCAALVHPDIKTVIPFVPEPIMKEDGHSKNDCERNASKRL